MAERPSVLSEPAWPAHSPGNLQGAAASSAFDTPETSGSSPPSGTFHTVAASAAEEDRWKTFVASTFGSALDDAFHSVKITLCYTHS